jgi:glycine hydroxymethyltransferase
MLLMGKDFENRLGIVARKSGRIRMMSEVFDSTIFPGIQGGPLMHVIAAKAVMLKEALEPSFRDYQEQVLKNCQALLKTLQSCGFRIVSGGSDNHLMLVDLTSKNITGKEATIVLGKAGITVNENLIPFDKQPATVTSGIRIGTPSVTSRGLKEKDMEEVGNFITDAIAAATDDKKLNSVREKVENLCNKFPLYR